MAPPDGPVLVPFQVPATERPTADDGTLVIRLAEPAADALLDEPGSVSVLLFDEDGDSPASGEPVPHPGFARRLPPGRYTVSVGQGSLNPTYAAACSTDVEVTAGAVVEVAFLGFPDPVALEPPPCVEVLTGSD